MPDNKEAPKTRIEQFAAYASRLGEAQVVGVFDNLIAPVTHKLQGLVAKALPLLAPPPGAIIGNWLKGRISKADFVRAMNKYGINMGQTLAVDAAKAVGVDVSKNVALWQAVAEDMMAYPGIGDALRAYWSGLFGEEGSVQAKKLLDEFGKLHAASTSHWKICEPTMRPWPGVADLNTGRNRGLLQPLEYDELMHLSTAMRADCLKLQEELRKQTPGVGDIVSMYSRVLSARHDSPLIQLFEERPDEMKKWFAWAGLDWETGIKPPPGKAGGSMRWEDLAWANHWRSPGWGMVQQMLWRVREDNQVYWGPGASDAKPMTTDAAREWLKHEGTPPNVREQMLAMRYAPVSVRYLKTMWQQNIVDTSFAEEQLKQSGQAPTVVDYIIRSWVKEKKDDDKAKSDRKQAECAKRLIAAIEKDLELGLLDPCDAGKALEERGLAQEDYPDCFASALLARRHMLVRAVLAKVKNLYVTGGIDEAGALKALGDSGLTCQASAQYLASWTAELSLEQRYHGGIAVATWLRAGLISAAEASKRLATLGFHDMDLALLLLQSDSAADRLMADAAEIFESGSRVAASPVVRLLKTTERIRDRAQGTLRRMTPVARLKKLYLEHVKPEAWIRQRLEEIGESAESIDLYVSEWDAAAAARGAKHTPKVAAAPIPSVVPATAIPESEASDLDNLDNESIQP